MDISEIVSKVNFKRLIIIPFLMLLIALVIVGYNYQADTIPKSIEFKGGTMIVIQESPAGLNPAELIDAKFGYNSKSSTTKDYVTGKTGMDIEFGEVLNADQKRKVKAALKEEGIKEDKIIIQSVGPSFSSLFVEGAMRAVVIAFLFMAIVVFIRFKTFVPSFAVVLSAFSDIVVTFAVMILLGIPLSPGSFVALLLLIGYSVDTDILLTTKLLVKREGTTNKRITGAMVTGLTMATTTFLAMLFLFIFSSANVLKEIAMVIMIGIVVDVINTWLQNVGILLWHVERSK